MMTMPVSTDGRTRRRERNVTAVLEVVHDLLLEGFVDLPPEEVAARSGVSLRSIYRYFPDRQELVLAALRHRVGAAELVFYIDEAGQGPRAARVERFVAHRLAVHDVLAPTARVALVAARTMPVLADAMRERREQLHALVSEHFAPDLGSLSSARREQCEEAIHVLCQFESVETLRVARGLDVDRVRAVLAAGVTAVLTGTD